MVSGEVHGVMGTALVLTLALGGPIAASFEWAEIVRALECRAEVEGRLRAWRASAEVYRGPSALDGADRYRIPTDRLGVWITLEVRADGRARLFRTDADASVEVELDAACGESERVLGGLPDVAGSQFTDDDLKSLLATNDRLVVYLWTPHLPLSVEGYHEIREATSAVGAAFVAVVDPSAEVDYVREISDAEGIPADARRRLASVELLFRDLAVHAPAVLVFAYGKARPVLPGYRSKRAYMEYLSSSRQR